MGFLEKLIIGGAVAVVGTLAVKGSRELAATAKEERRRRETPPQFNADLTQEDFSAMVRDVSSRNSRIITAAVDGLTIVITVRSNSGLTKWTAELDFNDYGNPSGRYWIRAENEQSPVPTWFGDSMQELMRQRLSKGSSQFT